MLKIKNLSFTYGNGEDAYEVFKNINVDINDNEFFCVIGPSGCGKSTLLKVIAGFMEPTHGFISEDGKAVRGVSYKRAMVFQEDAVFPWLTVYKNVEYGLKARGIQKEDRDKIVKKYINIVGLNGFEEAYPRQLSGGMRKRVDLARVLANDPQIFLMDEPFGSLDALTKEMLQSKLIEIWALSKKMVLFVTHDVEEALYLGDKVAIMQHINKGDEFKVYNVPHERPRNLSLKQNNSFQKFRRKLVEELK